MESLEKNNFQTFSKLFPTFFQTFSKLFPNFFQTFPNFSELFDPNTRFYNSKTCFFVRFQILCSFLKFLNWHTILVNIQTFFQTSISKLFSELLCKNFVSSKIPFFSENYWTLTAKHFRNLQKQKVWKILSNAGPFISSTRNITEQ